MALTSTPSLDMTTGHSNTAAKTRDSQFCPPYPNAVFETLDSSVPYLVNAALNVPLAIAATLTNLLVLLALRHVTSIRLPSKILFCSLVMTDLGAGLAVQPQFITVLFMKVIHPYSGYICSLFNAQSFTGSLFSGVSLLNMTAISLDRYTALFFPLRYQQIVTTRRVCAVLTFIWSFSLFFALSGSWNLVLWMTILLTSLPICLLVISVAYIKIYRRLRGQHGQQVQPQAHVQARQQAGSTLNVAKYKRTASTMMWIYILFVICFLPYLCANSITPTIGHTALTQCILELAYTFLLLNSCLNPFVYCWRLPEIRTEVIKRLLRFCCRGSEH